MARTCSKTIGTEARAAVTDAARQLATSLVVRDRP